jgi:alkylation response protein AidB-like acyl-CoA dehydrogenase
MEFGFTSEQDMLRKSFAEFLSKECPIETVKELNESDAGFSRSVWKKIANLGWLGLGYPEADGGTDGSFLDLFILFEEVGKVQMPGPLFESIGLSAQLIHGVGDEVQQKALLPSILAGKKVVIPAFLDEKGRYDGDHPAIEAIEREAGSYVLNGTRLLVSYAQVADEILVCGMLSGGESSGPTIFRIDGQADGLTQTPLDTLTGGKVSALSFNDVSASGEDILGEKGRGATYLGRIRQKATVLKCAEMIGGMQRVVDRTVDYTKERHQFGHPLGTLQVVQHYCADMTTLSETGRLIAYQAASLLSEGHDCEKEVAMAKAWCSDAYKQCTWIAHQIHGGIGFTDEFNLDLFYKHAKASELAFGDSWVHRTTVADEMGL